MEISNSTTNLTIHVPVVRLSENDFDFENDELADNLDELELSDEDLDVHAEELNSTSESSITDSAFISISLKERTPVSVFRNFFDEEVLKLITDQTNIYGKGKSSSEKNSNWKDVRKKEYESFVELVILVGMNNLPNMKLYSSEEMVFQNTFISSTMSRNRFRQIFYHLHLPDNSWKPKRGSREYRKIYKVKDFTDILWRNF